MAQYATVFRDGPFYDVAFGSREPRAEIQWNPTPEELTAKFLALTDERRRALTWEEAWGFVMPYDERELSGFQRRQDSGKLSPWEAVADLREVEVAPEPVAVPPEANVTALLLG